MNFNILRIVVIGRGDLSTAILHDLSHAGPPSSDDHHHIDQVTQDEDSNKCHNRNHEQTYNASTLYNLTLLMHAHQSPPPIPNLNHQISNFTPAALRAAFANQDVVISTTAPADTAFQKRLIDAAIAAQVSYFLPCEFSYDTLCPAIENAYPPSAARKHVLDYLVTRCGANEARKGDGMRWIGLATGAPLETGLTEGMLGYDLIWKTATIYGSGEERWAASTLAWIGRTVGALMERIQKGDVIEEYMYRPEVVTCQKQLLKAIEEVDGKQWDVIRADVEECVREGERRMEKGFFDGAMLLLERNVLFGQIGDVKTWALDQGGVEGEARLKNIVQKILEMYRRNGRPDCGCG